MSAHNTLTLPTGSNDQILAKTTLNFPLSHVLSCPGEVEDIDDGENDDVELLPDCELEVSEADKEKARILSQKDKEEEEAAQNESDAVIDLDLDSDSNAVSEKAVGICYVLDTQKFCKTCDATKICTFRMKEDDVVTYFCNEECVTKFIGTRTSKYLIKRSTYFAQPEATKGAIECYQCSEEEVSKFSIQQEDEKLYLCSDECLESLLSEQSDRVKQKTGVRVREMPLNKPAELEPSQSDVDATRFIARSEEDAETARTEREQTFLRRCFQCCEQILQITNKTLYWQSMDFCNEQCLGYYQNMNGATCATCQTAVPVASMGKYCVRFGFNVQQFCRSECLDQYKRNLKCCTYCQNDITSADDSLVAPVGEKMQYKDFCSQQCKKKYEDVITPYHKRRFATALCAVCNTSKPARIQVAIEGRDMNFCSNPCFSAFKFVNNVNTDPCGMCQKQFERRLDQNFTLYKTSRDFVLFCTKICMNIYITLNRTIVPCQWCKVKKYNFDMIQRQSNNQYICSLNCLNLCEVSTNAISMKRCVVVFYYFDPKLSVHTMF